MKIEPGTLVGDRYRIERELGRGGMGAVYVAFDTRFDKRVAVKVTAAGGGAHDVLRARFKREAMISNELGSESGFVRAFDWGEVPPHGLFLAMDLVEDASPLDLSSGPLQARLERLRAAAKLVERAHAAGIVHRDLKPANVLQDARGGIHLTDFGIAKVLSAPDESGAALTGGLTQSGVGMGTPHYMSPEQCADAKTVDARCDVFALGVMLFRALTGELPFPGSSLTEVVRKHLAVEAGTQAAPRPSEHTPEIPLALDALCAQAIHVDPAQRLGSVTELLAGLADALGSAPTTTAPAPSTAPGAEDSASELHTGALAPEPTASDLHTGALTPPPPAPSGADGPTAPTQPPSPRAARESSWGPKLVGLALIVALNVGGYLTYRGLPETPPAPPSSSHPSGKGDRPIVGLAQGAPALRVRRLDDACYVGQLTGVALEVNAQGPVTVEGPFSKDEGIVPGKEPTLEEGPLQGEAGVQTWTYTAVDAQGRRSLPASVKVEVKPPALSLVKLTRDELDLEAAVLRVEAGDVVEVVDDAGSHTPMQPGTEHLFVLALGSAPGKRTVSYVAVDASGNRSEPVVVELEAGSSSAPEVADGTPPREVPEVKRMPGYAALIERAKQVPGLSYLDSREFRCGGQAYRIARFGYEASDFVFHLLPGGTYRPGSPEGEVGRKENEGPCDPVTVEPFLLSATECTQQAWSRLMSGNPSLHKDPSAAVAGVDFVDVHEFCERAGFRLPSEEEWEYACRAGTETPWSFGAYSPEAFERYAWPPSASPLPAHPVGKKRPNAFGLYDMHSGVREWCDPGSAWGDYSGPGQLLGVSRGGPSFVDAQQCRSAVRVLHVPCLRPRAPPRGTTQSSTSSEVGFRPAISLP